MKSTTFARLALLLPYLILVESLIYFVFRDINEKDSWIQTFNIAWNFLAIFWFLPYTILVIFLLARSKGRSFAEVKRLFMSAPIRLMVISPVTYAIVLIIGTIVNIAFFENAWRLLLWAVAVSILASLILGYAFLGIALLLHKLLLKIGVVREDSQQLDLNQQNITT